MIGSLRGVVAALGLDNCIIETSGGVGYRVFMPSSQLAQLALGKNVCVQVHTAVREDAIILFGFLNQEAYELFELLLAVSGVGPKLALGILSAVKPETFYLAVQTKDIKALTKLPGIGKKTAERMLLELKDKLGATFKDEAAGDAAEADTGDGPVAEAIAALASLGYSNSEIMPVLQQIPDCASLTAEEILPRALRLFAKK